MSEAFLKVVNMSISAGWLVLAVLVLRLILKKAPKWVNVLLWGIVAVRLICPFFIESGFSLMPESLSSGALVDEWTDDYIGHNHFINEDSDYYDEAIAAGREPIPDGEGGHYVATGADRISEPSTVRNIVVPKLAVVWGIGMSLMVVYTVISFLSLRHKLRTAVILRDTIFQCETVSSPFVLGILKPRICLPYNMQEQDINYVIAHEQAHISRKDHWWKPLGFLLLTIHWFNPLMWVAYILLCRDIELACDEKVIAELGNEQRADYTQALVACAVNRRMIAACPLAFGEVGVKERVKSVMNYRKHAFWIIVTALVVCVVVAVCFLTDPNPSREFSMSGDNVANLNPEAIVDRIMDIENIDNSGVYMNSMNFSLQVDSDFNWADSQAVTYFFMKSKTTYKGQLRIFPNEEKYFLTEPSEGQEQQNIFLLRHYLEAIKYLPQEVIRQIAPADQYIIQHREEGTPNDYERVITYTPHGAKEIEGWNIHLQIQPLHEDGEAYSGTGEEVIDVFYSSGNGRTSYPSVKWFDYTEDHSEMSYEQELKIQVEEFPGITFKYTPYDIIATTSWDDSNTAGKTYLISGLPIWNAYFCDLTGDGLPEICSQVSYGSGIIDNRVIIHDYANGASYSLIDRGYHDYYLRMNEADGYLYVDKRLYRSDKLVSSGRLMYKDGCIQVEGMTSEPMEIPAPEQGFEGNVNLGLNAEIVEIDSSKQILYVKDIDASADVFGERCAIDCNYAISRYNLLYVNYGDPNDVRTIDFSTFEVGDAIIIGMYESEKEKAFNGSAIAEQVQLSTQRLSAETEFSVNFAGNTSLHHQFVLTEDRPYWCILVENYGTEKISTEVGGEVRKIEPGTFDKIFSNEKGKPGTYSVSFATSGSSGMTGKAVCYTYKYRIEITGRLHNAVKDTTYIILTNIEGITFEQAWKANGLSSNMDDSFDPADAVFIGIE